MECNWKIFEMSMLKYSYQILNFQYIHINKAAKYTSWKQTAKRTMVLTFDEITSLLSRSQNMPVGLDVSICE